MSKPSTFSKIDPFNSKCQNSDDELVAQNIMVILKRTGDEFRELTWAEYKKERLKDGGFTGREKGLFNNVIKYCISEEAARSFSPKWKEA